MGLELQTKKETNFTNENNIKGNVTSGRCFIRCRQ